MRNIIQALVLTGLVLTSSAWASERETLTAPLQVCDSRQALTQPSWVQQSRCRVLTPGTRVRILGAGITVRVIHQGRVYYARG